MGGTASTSLTGPSSGGAGAAGLLSPGDALLQALWRQRWWIGWCGAGAVLVAALYLLVAPRTYWAAAKIYVQPAGPRVLGDGKAQLVDSSGDNFLATQRQMLLATPTLAAALEKLDEHKLKTFEDVTDRFEFLKENVSVAQGKSDDLLTISFEARDGGDAAKIANAVVVAYMARHAKQKEATAGDVLTILKREKDQVEQDLAGKTHQMLEFRRAKGVLSYSAEDKGNVNLQQLKSLSDALTTAHLDTFAAKTAYEEALHSIASDPAKIAMLERAERGGATGVGAAEESQLRLQLLQGRAQLASARNSYLPNHPTVLGIQKQVDAMEVGYVAALGRRLETAEQRERELRASFEKQQTEAITRSADAAQYERMAAEVVRLERLAETLGNRIKEVQLTEASGAMNIVPVEWALPPRKAHSPKVWRTLAASLVAGLLTGVGLACVRDWRDPRLRTAEEVKAVLGVPVLGQTPRLDPRLAAVPAVRGRQVLLDPAGAIAEACRGLRTALHYGLRDGRSRTILFTSPAPRDGKSTLTSNLAIAMAQMGKRVLLVDADLRRPTQHETFCVANVVGLSTLLRPGAAASEADLAAAVRPTDVDGLHLLTSGPVPEKPAELLNSNRFVTLLAKLAADYDHVLIDSPPVGAVADARIIAASCDATVLLLNADRINRGSSEAARDALLGVGASIVGLVLNGVSPDSPFYRGEYQGYYGRDGDDDIGTRGHGAGRNGKHGAGSAGANGGGAAVEALAATRAGADDVHAGRARAPATVPDSNADVIVDGLGRTLSRAVLFEAMRAALRERRMPFRRKD